MEFNFSVDKSKKIKRQINRGEDAPPVSKEGILIVCDGTGATGQSVHNIGGEEYTSAYLGSRKTMELTEKFIDENYEKIIEAIKTPDELKTLIAALGDEIRKGLLAFVKENNLALTVRGRSFRMLPTTLAAAIYKVYDDHIDIVALSAGDSRVLLWEPEEGLHQLSIDDVESGYDAFSDVSNTNNCISADNDFKINYVVHTISQTKCILLATSDGFTDPIKPFDQERYLIQWLGNCDCVLDAEESKVAEYIGDALDNDGAGFTGKDDCSIAAVIIGYESDSQLKDSLRSRFDYVAKTFSLPYRDLDKRCKEAIDEYNRAGVETRKIAEQTKARIREKLVGSVSLLLPSDYISNQAVYNFLSSQACINAETSKLKVEYEEKLKRAEVKLNRANTEAQEAFVKFFRQYCFINERNGYDTVLPSEILWYLKEYRTTSTNKAVVYDAYNVALRRFKSMSEINIGINLFPNENEIRRMCDDIVYAVSEVSRLNSAFEKANEIINIFFSIDNVQLIDIYEQQKRNNFESFDKSIEKLKPRMSFLRGKNDDADYNQLKGTKLDFDNVFNKLRRARSEYDSVKISDAEKLQRYKSVVRNNMEELVNAVLSDPSVFSFFAGEEKADYDAKMIAGEQASEKAKSLIELKNELWKKYKTLYELFQLAEKDCVVVPKKSEG